MNTRRIKASIRIMLALLPIQGACVSHQYQPDPTALTNSANCEIVEGSYIVDSSEDGRILAEYLFHEDEVVSVLAIKRTAKQISVSGKTVNGQALPRQFFSRLSCHNSVLKVILSDQYSANGVYMEASDRVVELFVSDESSLNLRFINTTLAFFFIIPYYSSGDQLVTLRKQPTELE